MPENIDLPLFLAAFGILAALAGLAGAITTLLVKDRAKHRKRLERVSKRRFGGRLEVDDMRLTLARVEEGSGPLERLTMLLARVIPLLDTDRLQASLTRAGLKLTTGGFVLWSCVIALVPVLPAFFIFDLPLMGLVPVSLVFGMIAMNAFVAFRGDVMSNRFLKQLPDALDTIIRGIRSGLPVIECIASAGEEGITPLGPHFRSVTERVQLGEPLESALWRVARVVGKPEVDFFAVTISIQMETGGSLSEALGNLAELLRRREHMKLKIKAISSEAKASALIIGFLPFGMLGLLLGVSPDYVMPLFTDTRGRIMLAVGFTSIAMGGYIMWRMTQFEI